MVVRGYLIREVWATMRCSTVFSRVPGTEYSDQNLPVRLSESNRHHKNDNPIHVLHLHFPSFPTHDRDTYYWYGLSVNRIIF